MEINGLPLHALVVHATVVFVPLGALGALLYVVPKWRWLLRWPTLLVNLAAAVLVQISIMSGEDLERDRKLFSPQVHTHEEWAEKLRIAVFILAVIVVVAFWALGYVTRLSGGTDRESRVPALETVMMVLLPVAAVAVLVLVFLTGDAGAKAVWG
jgi:magnesium-transporting ATPase (P-type)